MRLELVNQQSHLYKDMNYINDVWKELKTKAIRRLIILGLLAIVVSVANFGILLLMTKGNIVNSLKIVIYIATALIDLIIILLLVNPDVEFLSLYSRFKEHIYSPYSVSPSDLMQHELYSEAKSNPKTVFVDPLYVGRLNPKGAYLRSGEKIHLNWIPYKKRGIEQHGLYFAIIPLTLVVTKHNDLVIRVFLRNLNDTPKVIELYYIPDMKKFKHKEKTLIGVSVKPNSIYYRDIVIPIDYIMETGYERIRWFRIVNKWQEKKEEILERTMVETTKMITTTKFDVTVGIFPYFFEKDSIDEIKSNEDLELLLEKTDYFGLTKNSFIAPTAIKEIVIFSLTKGELYLKEDYLWVKSVANILLTAIRFLPLLGINSYFFYLSLTQYSNNVFFCIVFAILSFASFLGILSHILVFSENANKLHKIGLTKNEKYITQEDIFEISDIGRDKIWLLGALKNYLSKKMTLFAISTSEFVDFKEGVTLKERINLEEILYYFDLHDEEEKQQFLSEMATDVQNIAISNSLYYSPNFKEVSNWERTTIELPEAYIKAD